MLAAIAGSFSSCTPVAPYQPEQVPDGLQLYFPTTELAASYDLNDIKGDQIDIPVCRIKCDEAATVNITSSVDPAGAVTIPASVDFGYQATQATLTIKFDREKIAQGTEVKIKLSIPDAANTSVYGDTEALIVLTNPVPELWIKFDTGTLTESDDFWGEKEEGKTLYYMEVGENIRYCKIEDCFGHDTIKDGGEYPVQDYLFYWNTETNLCYIDPHWMGYSDYWYASEYINYATHYGWTYETGTEAWFKQYDLVADAVGFHAYYDGNGGFYLADCYIHDMSGSQAGYGVWDITPDTFICDGFVRTTDYNTAFKYKNIYSAKDDSSVFEEEFDCMIAVTDADSTVRYIPDYFTTGSGLAFIIPADQYDEKLERTKDGATITKGDNEQYSGVMQWGYEIVANIAKKSKVNWSEDAIYPEYDVNISLDLYSVTPAEKEGDPDEKALAFELGTFMDKIEVTGPAWYTADDLIGLKKESYLGNFYCFADDIDSGNAVYWPVSVTDGGESSGSSWLDFHGLAPIKPELFPADANVVPVEWYKGFLYFTADSEFNGKLTYKGEDYPVYLDLCSSAEAAGYYYDSGYLLGGYVEDDDAIACVNYPYNPVECDGLFFYVEDLTYMAYAKLEFFWDESAAIAHANSFTSKDALKIKKSVMNAGKFSYAKTQMLKNISTAKPATRAAYNAKITASQRTINTSKAKRVQPKQAEDTMAPSVLRVR